MRKIDPNITKSYTSKESCYRNFQSSGILLRRLTTGLQRLFCDLPQSLRYLSIFYVYLLYTQPVGEIWCICQSSRQTNDTHRLLSVGRNEVRPRHNHLQHRASLLSQQMDLINHKKCHCLHIVTCLPASTDAIPLFRGSDDHIGLSDSAHVRCHVSGQLNDTESEWGEYNIL